MRSIKYLLAVCIILSFSFGCSNDDSLNNEQNQALNFRDITFIAENNFQVYQVDLSNNAEDINAYNISTSINLFAFDLLDVHENLLTFFTLTADNFLVQQYDISTFETLLLESICSTDESEYRRGPIVSDNVIGFVTTQVNVENPMNFITTFNKSTSQCNKTILGRGSIVGSRYIEDDIMYFTLIDENENYIIRRINLNDLYVGQDLSFTEIFKATIQNEKLHVFFFDNNYDVYDKNTLEKLSSSSFNTDLLNPIPGLFETQIKDNIIYTQIEYQQPSPLAYGPASIDLSTGNYIGGDDELAIRIRQQLNDLYAVNVELTDFVYDLENNLIIYGFDVGPFLGAGGILYTNFEGELLKIVDLDYVPARIIVR